jgi:L-ribulokinase
LGAAIAGAVVAGAKSGGFDTVAGAQARMCGVKPQTYKPNQASRQIYGRLYSLYKQLHDAFGLDGHSAAVANVMKDLLRIKDDVKR